jgi:hypothetical protein
MTVVIFDGDVIAHMAAEAPFRIRCAEFEKAGIDLDQYKGKKLDFYFPEHDAETFERCRDNFLLIMDEAKDRFWTNDHLMAMKSSQNFRDDLYPAYKAKRGKYRIENPWVHTMRQWAVEQDLAVFAHDMEADDFLRIWAEQCQTAGQRFVIASIDKDLYCIEGKHYNLKKKEVLDISKFEAMRHYYLQLLVGDAVDNIPGLPGIGPKKAEVLLEDCEEEEDFQEVVVSMYLEKHGDEWENYLLSNGKMIHIMRHENDHFVIKDWPLVQELRK